jgi:cytochrome c biogenesis protein CcmG/thiol:disulfide interchange protein DsbE
MRSVLGRTLVALLAGCSILAFTFQGEDKGIKKLEGKAVPKFTLTDLRGVSATSDSFKGRVVLLDFWATWCGPCKAAAPYMQRLHDNYARQGLLVIGATAMERGDVMKNVTNYLNEHRYTYTFTTDNTELARSWGISGIPTFVMIDRKGVVRGTWVGSGEANMKSIEATARTLLAER